MMTMSDDKSSRERGRDKEREEKSMKTRIQ